MVERTVRKGLEPKSQTSLVFTGPAQVSLPERWVLSALGEVLEIRLREELREELSGTYSVSVGPSLARIPREQYSVSIGFGSAPDLADSLVRAIFTEIDSLKAKGPRSADLAKVKETFIRGRETALRENGWWLSQLMLAAREGDRAGPAARAVARGHHHGIGAECGAQISGPLALRSGDSLTPMIRPCSLLLATCSCR